jgi:hypothetical protein
VRYKQPLEGRTLTFEFADKLNAGDSILEATVPGSVSADDGINVTTGQLDDTRVNTRVSGGTVDTDYVVACRVSTNQGDVLEIDVVVAVREGVN